MIVELLVLGGALTAGRAAWRRRRARVPSPELELPDEASPRSRLVDGQVVSIAAGLGLAAASTVARSTPLGLMSAPLVVWSSREMLSEAWHRTVHEGRPGYLAVDAGMMAVGLASGAWLMAATSSALYIAWRKMADAQRYAAVEGHEASRSAPLSSPTVWRDLPARRGCTVSAGVLEHGDRLRLRTGDAVPADVRVRGGRARIDAGDGRLVTREVGPGDTLPAGARVIAGEIDLHVVRVETRDRRLRETPNSRGTEVEGIAQRAGRLADGSSGFSLLTGALAALTIGGTSAVAALGSDLFGPYRVIGPLALAGHIRSLRPLGVRIADSRSLELLAGVSTIVVDLSTLVDRANLAVDGVWAADGFDTADGLRWAAGLASPMREPAGPALVEAALERGLTPPDGPVRVRQGVYHGWSDGRRLTLGGAAGLAAEGITADPGLAAVRRAARASGRSTLTLAVDGAEALVLAFEPRLRPGAEALFPALSARGIDGLLVVADGEAVATRWGRRLGTDRILPESDPEAVEVLVRTLRDAGQMVLAVGDRVVHRPMMGAADLSMATGDDPAVATGADIRLAGVPIDALPGLVDLARRHHRNQGKVIALNTGASGALAFGVLVFGLGPLTVLASQAAVCSAGLVMGLPDLQPLAALPAIEPAEPVDDARPRAAVGALVPVYG